MILFISVVKFLWYRLQYYFNSASQLCLSHLQIYAGPNELKLPPFIVPRAVKGSHQTKRIKLPSFPIRLGKRISLKLPPFLYELGSKDLTPVATFPYQDPGRAKACYSSHVFLPGAAKGSYSSPHISLPGWAKGLYSSCHLSKTWQGGRIKLKSQAITFLYHMGGGGSKAKDIILIKISSPTCTVQFDRNLVSHLQQSNY